MKYSKYRLAGQIREYDCVPAALINIMKLTGTKISYKASVPALFKKLKMEENLGVYMTELDGFIKRHRALKKCFVEEDDNLNYNDIIRQLKEGKVALLAFGRGATRSGHACVIAGYNREGLEIVNWNRKGTIQTVGFDRFKHNVLTFNEATYYFFERN